VHGVTTFSKNPDEAFEALAFHSSLEFAVQGLLTGMGATVGRPDLFEDPRTLKIVPGIEILTPIMAEIEKDFFVGNYRGPEFNTEWAAQTDLLLLDKQDTSTTVENIVKNCQDVLDKEPA
jgi:hypothetical protein